MRVTKLALLVPITVAVAACTSVAPNSTPFIVTPITPLPGSSVLPSLTLPSLPVVPATIGPATITPASEPPTIAPTTPPTEPPTAPPTPKPTRKPTPSPSPTPPPTPGDAEVLIDTSTIPSTWYANQPYTIRIYVSALGTQDLPNVRVKVVAMNEGVSETYMTGSINYGGSVYKDVQLTLPAYGPTTISATATLPNGFVDTNKNNNRDSFDVTVQAAP